MNATNSGNITGGWRRVAHVDMTDEINACPENLTYTVIKSTRMCTRTHSGRYGCSSVTFPTHGGPYTKVCGRARGYQFYATSAFVGYHNGLTSLNDAYVSGLSVTSGSLQNHIWTFAAGPSKTTVATLAATAPVALILVQMHLHLWEKIIFVNREILDDIISTGNLMTLCGTHSGVQVGALAVIVVVHGSEQH